MPGPTDVQRRLVAVFAADVEGYSRLMGADEVETLKRLTECRAVLDKAIADHRGRIANTAGDSVLAEFGSAVAAVRCAVEAQAALAEANSSLSPDKRINFRVGIHVGDVMVRAGDLYGDGVNIAARLQALAQPGSVCVSGVTRDQVRKVLPLVFTDLGVRQVKNIEEPIKVYAVSATALPAIGGAPRAEHLPLPELNQPCRRLNSSGYYASRPSGSMLGKPISAAYGTGVSEVLCKRGLCERFAGSAD